MRAYRALRSGRGLVARPVFKTGRASQPGAWKVRFLRRFVGATDRKTGLRLRNGGVVFAASCTGSSPREVLEVMMPRSTKTSSGTAISSSSASRPMSPTAGDEPDPDVSPPAPIRAGSLRGRAINRAGGGRRAHSWVLLARARSADRNLRRSRAPAPRRPRQGVSEWPRATPGADRRSASFRARSLSPCVAPDLRRATTST